MQGSHIVVSLNSRLKSNKGEVEVCAMNHWQVRKADVRLPGKGNSNSHGARLVHLIVSMIK
jgi:hypothetical protein